MNISEIISAQAADDDAAQKSFSCSFCTKCFERRSDCKRHERFHTGVGVYACEYEDCRKRFIQRSALKVHMRVHTGEKPHICEQCGRPFSDPSSLARHRPIHSGRRPHKCPYADCQKTFTRLSTMNRHRDRHTRTVEEAATATAAALATRAGSNRGDRQRSDGEQYSNPMLALSPSKRHLTASPHSELAPLNSMQHYPGEYQYINNSHLPDCVRGNYHMQGQQPPTTAPYSSGTRPTSHLTVYVPPSILESPADSDRQSGSTVVRPHMSSVGYQSLSQGSIPSLSQSNTYVYPDPEYCQP